MQLKAGRCVWLVAAMLTVGITGGAARAASPSPQERDQQAHDQDYSRNKNYQQGLRDGQDDRAHNQDHSKKRHFKKDEDQKAYEAGYQEAHRGNQRQDNESDRH